MDDFSIHSETAEEHLEHMKIVLESLKNHNIKLQEQFAMTYPDKCKWFKTKVKLLEHII